MSPILFLLACSLELQFSYSSMPADDTGECADSLPTRQAPE